MGMQGMIVYDIYVSRANSDEEFKEFTTDCEREAREALAEYREVFRVAPGSHFSVWMEEREMEDT